MKRLRLTQIVAAVLLFALSLIPTSSFAIPDNWEHDYIYYLNGAVNGYRIYNSCFGHADYLSGQYSGDVLLDRYIFCDEGGAHCDWYVWDGSGWVLSHSGSCSTGGGLPRPYRPDI